MKDRVFLYFVKSPEPGRVKTRLAREVGPQRAAEIYRELAEKNLTTLAALSKTIYSVAIAFDPPEAEERIKAWLPDQDEYLPQRGDDLGKRLAQAFDKVFERGARGVLALGSDTLGLEKSLLEEAGRALDSSDVALGPTEDGGYYLIGLRRPEPRLFEEIPWSTSAVFEKTLERIRREKLSYTVLRKLSDLDEGKEER